MDAYKIGVSIALSNGMSPILALISKDLLGLNTKVKDIENNFTKWRLAVGGVAGIMAGGAFVRGLNKIADHGYEILHQQEMMVQMGMQNKEIVEATARSWEVSRKIQVTTASENLKHIRELRYATGDTEGAMAILEPVTKANAILNALKGGGQDQVFNMVKALEQKGLATPEHIKDFMSYVDMMTKVTQATGGRVTSEMFQQTFKYGRTSMLGWNEEFITQIMPRLMQSWASGKGGGGGTGGPGNALMSAYSLMMHGTMTKTEAEQMKSLGLLESMHHITGSSKTQATIKGRDLFIDNPYEWVQQVMMPALSAHGITEQHKILEAVSKVFPIRTAGSAMAEFALQGRYHEGPIASQFEKDRRQTTGALGLAGYDSLMANDPKTINAAYDKQKEAMLEGIGATLVPIKLEVLQGLTKMFTAVAQFAAANPETVKAIGVALGILGGALLVGGIVALGSAMTGLVVAAGPAVAAIGAVAGAMSWLSSVVPHLPSFLSKDPSGAYGLDGTGGFPSGLPPAALPSGRPSTIPGADGIPSFQRQNFVPPPRSSGARTHTAAVYLDGARVGDYVMRHISDSASLPTQGSAHFDATRHSYPTDTALG